MNRKVPTIYWRVTAAVAGGLLITTIILAARAGNAAEVGRNAYLQGKSLMVSLHEDPSHYARTIAVLERGTQVIITKVEAHDDDLSWYYVEGESVSGWVDGLHLSLDPP